MTLSGPQFRENMAAAWDAGWDAGAEYTGAAACGYGDSAGEAMEQNARLANPYREPTKKYQVWQEMMGDTFVLNFFVREQNAAQWAENNPNAIVMEASF